MYNKRNQKILGGNKNEIYREEKAISHVLELNSLVSLTLFSFLFYRILYQVYSKSQ